MLFLMVAKGRDDDAARRRREALRPRQLELVKVWADQGIMKFGGALLAEDACTPGAMALLEFDDREACDAWLAQHPYAVNGVWESVEVSPVSPPPLFARVFSG